MYHALAAGALAEELGSTVSAELLGHGRADVVRMLEGFRCPLKDGQVDFVDEHVGSEARAGRPTAIVAMAIEDPHRVAFDLIPDGAA